MATKPAELVARSRQRKAEAGLKPVTVFLPQELTGLIAQVQQDHGYRNRGEALAHIIRTSAAINTNQETPATN